MRRLIVILCLLSALASAQIRGPHRKVFAAAPAGCGAVGTPCTDSFQNETVIDTTKWTLFNNANPTFTIGGSGASSYLGAAGMVTGGGVALMQYTGGTFGNNQIAEVTFTDCQTNPNSVAVGPAVRITDGTHYTAVYAKATFTIKENAGSGVTQTGTGVTYTCQNGDIARIAVSGTAVTATITRSGSTLATSVATTALSTGAPGIVDSVGDWSSKTWHLNNFSGVSQ